MRSAKPVGARERMTREYNRTMALSKIDTAPLDTLTESRLASISNCHAAPRERPAMLAALRERLVERKAREGVGG